MATCDSIQSISLEENLLILNEAGHFKDLERGRKELTQAEKRKNVYNPSEIYCSYGISCSISDHKVIGNFSSMCENDLWVLMETLANETFNPNVSKIQKIPKLANFQDKENFIPIHGLVEQHKHEDGDDKKDGTCEICKFFRSSVELCELCFIFIFR